MNCEGIRRKKNVGVILNQKISEDFYLFVSLYVGVFGFGEYVYFIIFV